jgi:hypothetical protein
VYLISFMSPQTLRKKSAQYQPETCTSAPQSYSAAGFDEHKLHISLTDVLKNWREATVPKNERIVNLSGIGSNEEDDLEVAARDQLRAGLEL